MPGDVRHSEAEFLRQFRLHRHPLVAERGEGTRSAAELHPLDPRAKLRQAFRAW